MASPEQEDEMTDHVEQALWNVENERLGHAQVHAWLALAHEARLIRQFLEGGVQAKEAPAEPALADPSPPGQLDREDVVQVESEIAEPDGSM
jgi:hypothetical protein